MASGGYESLRNAKAAFDEGLIDEHDVQIIRTAFLRAQQIKAGLDAGFIQEDDFKSVKQAFLNSLNMSADPSTLLGECNLRAPRPHANFVIMWNELLFKSTDHHAY
jgi:hypothetical protein